MVREETKELLPIMRAFAEGKVIEIFDDVMGWVETENPTFNLSPEFYRIKPEEKYRPFKDQRECWEEMHKHSDFGFIRDKSTNVIYNVNMIDNYFLSTQDKSEPLSDTLNVYEFLDGKPFGIKEG